MSQKPRPPTFVKGYPTSTQQYHNIGYRTSPYPGKKGQGDYGPRSYYLGTPGGSTSVNGNAYYVNPDLALLKERGYAWPSMWHYQWNPNYPYPLDFSTAVSQVATIQSGYSDATYSRNKK